MELPIHNTQGEVVGSLPLDETVFGLRPHVAIMHQAMLRQLTNARQGTVNTLTRGEVTGGGHKPYKQKGTGRARQGSRRAPHFRGGGVVFGPHPRQFEHRMPRKMRQVALRSALSTKAQAQELIVVDEIVFPEPRTRDLAAILSRLNVQGSALLVLADGAVNVIKSARNLAGIDMLPANALNVVALLRHRYLVMPVAAVRQIEQLYRPAEAEVTEEAASAAAGEAAEGTDETTTAEVTVE
ncbi:MAG: 50S ribosomal protein L4 [Chloroflexi bacterium]|nr:50S ribosomal protein L4 [Chloroflexota bacterium]